MGDVLDVREATVRRDGRVILDSVDWSVDDGQRWVVLGPNGAGKTTLTELLSGRMHPTIGSVAFVGVRLGRVNLEDLRPLVGTMSAAIDARIPGDQRTVDVVRTAAYGRLATWREVYDPLDDRRARALLAGLGVGSLETRLFSTLSSGEKKRVGIARALMPNPEVLILDEPASGLDLGGRENLVETLSQLAFEPFSPVIVLVTHHVEEIPPGFTHALLLKDGAVYASGPIAETVTSANLSAVFGLNLAVSCEDGRFSARKA